MSDKTGIEWTDATWNPIRGCSRVSEGCRNCYAESVAARFSGPGLPYEGLARRTASGEARWTGVAKMVPKMLDQPMRWQKPRRIFVNSMSDLFHESLDFRDIAAIFGVMALAGHHTFQVLTKRPARMVEWFQWASRVDIITEMSEALSAALGDGLASLAYRASAGWPLPNVWLGVSVENQEAAHTRVALLRATPAAVRFLSCEPLLGPLYALDLEGIGWVIAGGESGPHARPMHPDWVRKLRDDCARAGVPFFFKQWGEWVEEGSEEAKHSGQNPFGPLVVAAGEQPEAKWMVKVGKKAAGSLLDGVEHKAFPREVARV